MRQRIKKYLKENEEYLLGYAVGVIAGGLAIFIVNRDKMNGMKICCGNMLEGTDGNVFMVHLKNNEQITFIRPQEGWPN